MEETMNQNERRLFLIRSLLNERLEYRDWRIPQDVSDQKLLLRGLLNVRPAQVCNPEFLRVQDAYLCQATAEKGITDCSVLSLPCSRDCTSGRATLPR